MVSPIVAVIIIEAKQFGVRGHLLVLVAALT